MNAIEVVTIGESLVAFVPDSRTKLRYVHQFGKVVVGAESNVAVGLAKLGHRSGWVSKVGEDEFGQFMLRELRAEGVDTGCVKVSSDGPTAIMFKQFSADGTSQVYYYRKDSAASTLSGKDIDWEYLKQAKIIHVSGITPAISMSCRTLVPELFAFARQNGILVNFDPNIRRKLWSEEEAKQVLSPLLAMSDIVLLGEDEGELLLGCKGYRQIASTLLDLGVKAVAVKRGEDGAYVADMRGSHEIPKYPVKVVDTIGAGDAFNAGFLSGLLENQSIEQCGKMGALMGAFAVSTYGDVEGLPDRSAFDAAMANITEVQR